MRVRVAGPNDPNRRGIGKRLWLRTPDKRWVEVPYGAGQDSKIRSINVWDGQHWQTPVYGWSVWDDLGEDTFIPSAQVYAPEGYRWLGYEDDGAHPTSANEARWNPNFQGYRADDNEQFTPEHPFWLRFFHTRRRVDADWRIVPLGVRLPRTVPNRTINQDFDMLSFWPSTTYRERVIDLYASQTGLGSNDIGSIPSQRMSRNWLNDDPDFNIGSVLGFDDTGYHDHPSPAIAAQYTSIGMVRARSILIDLEGLRQRLRRDFPHQGVDYCGQYKHIDEMQVKRVFVHVLITGQVDIIARLEPDVLAHLASTSMGIKTHSNNPATPYELTDTRTSAQSLFLNIPDATITSEASSNIYFRQGYGDLENVSIYETTVSGQPGTYVRYIAHFNPQAFTLTFEAPGNDIGFFPYILQPTLTPDGNVFSGECRINMAITRATVHYATAGHDTPASTWFWNQTGSTSYSDGV